MNIKAEYVFTFEDLSVLIEGNNSIKLTIPSKKIIDINDYLKGAEDMLNSYCAIQQEANENQLNEESNTLLQRGFFITAQKLFAKKEKQSDYHTGAYDMITAIEMALRGMPDIKLEN